MKECNRCGRELSDADIEFNYSMCVACEFHCRTEYF